jgi:hypothetical protein
MVISFSKGIFISTSSMIAVVELVETYIKLEILKMQHCLGRPMCLPIKRETYFQNK